MSKASYILVPISNRGTKFNLSQTVKFDEGDVGYWSSPGGSQGDKCQVGDQIWFYAGKNDQDPEENCIQGIGTITKIVDPVLDEDVHTAMRQAWEGDWSKRKILVFKLLPLLEKDKLTYNQLLKIFSSGDRMANGSYRMKV
jgi:hypothetical protein